MTATHPLAAAVLQQEAGEPVGEVVGTEKRGFALMTLVRWEPGFDRTKLGTKLYATPQVSPPQARVPLTVDEVITEWSRPCYSQDIHIAEAFEAGVRFAERAHLIGLETKE